MKNSTEFFFFEFKFCFLFFFFLIVRTECQTRNNKCSLRKEKKKKKKNPYFPQKFPQFVSTTRKQKQEATSLIASYCSQIRLFHGAKISRTIQWKHGATYAHSNHSNNQAIKRHQSLLRRDNAPCNLSCIKACIKFVYIYIRRTRINI